MGVVTMAAAVAVVVIILEEGVDEVAPEALVLVAGVIVLVIDLTEAGIDQGGAAGDGGETAQQGDHEADAYELGSHCGISSSLSWVNLFFLARLTNAHEKPTPHDQW